MICSIFAEFQKNYQIWLKLVPNALNKPSKWTNIFYILTNTVTLDIFKVWLFDYTVDIPPPAIGNQLPEKADDDRRLWPTKTSVRRYYQRRLT